MLFDNFWQASSQTDPDLLSVQDQLHAQRSLIVCYEDARPRCSDPAGRICEQLLGLRGTDQPSQ